MAYKSLDSRYALAPDRNSIGVAGRMGFGVGIYPETTMPSGFTALAGTETPGNDEWGNYEFQDGSIVCWIPAHWVKIGTGANGFAVNIISVLKYSSFSSEAVANAAGYFLPRAFMDGGSVKLGVFVDKYMCSKNAWGTGYIASSIKDGLPISTAADHNPIADLTACTNNYYYEAITAAKARDGVDGAVAADPQWFCCSRFIYGMLAMLSMAHGQAATSATWCAWYDATGAKNYPKGNNNNALADTDDATVTFTSDGYTSNAAKTGSGSPFAKTTHNGQNCGVTDLNGNMYEISTGLTCIATSKTITAVTNANPCQITAASHGRSNDDYVQITSVGGTTQLNDKIFKITVVDENNFTLQGVDSSAFGAFTTGGSATFGDWYVAKDSVAMKDFTSGNSGATDHWGATGVAAMMDEFIPAFKTTYPNNGFAQRYGSGANQVLSETIGSVLTGLGLPKDAGGIDTTGVNLFGKDYYYQYIRNELCAISGGGWDHTSYAGVWYLHWNVSRAYSNAYVGFRCACYA